MTDQRQVWWSLGRKRISSSLMLAADVFGQYRVNAGLPARARVLEKQQNFGRKPDRRRNLARPTLRPALTTQSFGLHWLIPSVVTKKLTINSLLIVITAIDSDNKKPPSGGGYWSGSHRKGKNMIDANLGTISRVRLARAFALARHIPNSPDPQRAQAIHAWAIAMLCVVRGGK